jgi:hypothetical protein
MKNSASEIFCIDHSTTYQHAFGYIRQLAIQLRNSMKIRSKVRSHHLLSQNRTLLIVVSFISVGNTNRTLSSPYTIGNMSIALTFGLSSLPVLVRRKENSRKGEAN